MSQVETVFRHNGAEYEFDMFDADTADKFQTAYENMQKNEKDAPKDGRLAELTRGQCKLIKAFFNDTLGAGSGDAVCGEKDNLSACYEAYSKFMDFINEQKKHLKEISFGFAKYSNRQQRRHPPKNNGKPVNFQQKNHD